MELELGRREVGVGLGWGFEVWGVVIDMFEGLGGFLMIEKV